MPLLDATHAPEKRLRGRRWVVGLLLVPALILELLVAPFFRPVSFQAGSTRVVVWTYRSGQSGARGVAARLLPSRFSNPVALGRSPARHQASGPINVRGVTVFGQGCVVAWFPGRRVQ